MAEPVIHERECAGHVADELEAHTATRGDVPRSWWLLLGHLASVV